LKEVGHVVRDDFLQVDVGHIAVDFVAVPIKQVEKLVMLHDALHVDLITMHTSGTSTSSLF